MSIDVKTHSVFFPSYIFHADVKTKTSLMLNVYFVVVSIVTQEQEDSVLLVFY